MGVVIVAGLVSSVYFPLTAVILVAVWCTGRFIYTVGYVRCGPNGRLIGTLIMLMMEIGCAGLMIASTIMKLLGEAKAEALPVNA